MEAGDGHLDPTESAKIDDPPKVNQQAAAPGEPDPQVPCGPVSHCNRNVQRNEHECEAEPDDGMAQPAEHGRKKQAEADTRTSEVVIANQEGGMKHDEQTRKQQVKFAVSQQL